MNNLITWLNNNAGATTAILTAIYVMTTIILLVYNHRSLNEMRKTRLESTKPQVVMSFEVRRKGLLCLIIKNFGSSPAHSISLTMSESWILKLNQSDQDKYRKLKDAKLSLVPNQELIFVLGASNIFKEISTAELDAKICYSDFNDNKYEIPFNFNFQSYESTLLYGPQLDELTSTINNEMSKGNRLLNNINDTLISLKKDKN